MFIGGPASCCAGETKEGYLLFWESVPYGRVGVLKQDDSIALEYCGRRIFVSKGETERSWVGSHGWVSILILHVPSDCR